MHMTGEQYGSATSIPMDIFIYTIIFCTKYEYKSYFKLGHEERSKVTLSLLPVALLDSTGQRCTKVRVGLKGGREVWGRAVDDLSKQIFRKKKFFFVLPPPRTGTYIVDNVNYESK